MSGPSEVESPARPKPRFPLFRPILAGATLRDRLIACFGALVGIATVGFLCRLMFGSSPQLPLLVAPVGASAVLLFAVPASPLAQPWPIIGGNVISAFTGILIARLIQDPILAAGTAVAVAIAVMSFARCLHPPGGAAALLMVITHTTQFHFAFFPVLLNSLLLVGMGVLFNSLTGRIYPRAQLTATQAGLRPVDGRGFSAADLDAALAH